MSENSQTDAPTSPEKTFLVGCRVAGEIQHYHVPAVEYRQAREFVMQGVEGANPVLVRVK